MLIRQSRTEDRGSGRAERIWYVPHPFLRTREARDAARAKAREFARAEVEASRDHEIELFKLMHVCAYWSRPRRSASAALRRAWTGRWRLIRDRLVSSNLGLVYSTVQRFSGHGSDGDDALSDALYALLCAVERFNPWRGFRFSTYACNCIVRSVLRHRQREQRHRERFPAYYDPDFERPSEEPDDRGSLVLDRLHRVMAANGGELTPLESSILAQRFPLREEGRLTFAAIGRRIGLSKERVRQIQNAALLKLRWALEADPLLG